MIYKCTIGEVTGNISEVSLSISGLPVTKFVLPETIAVTEHDCLELSTNEIGEVVSVSICSTLDLNQFFKDSAKIMSDKLTYDSGE